MAHPIPPATCPEGLGRIQALMCWALMRRALRVGLWADPAATVVRSSL